MYSNMHQIMAEIFHLKHRTDNLLPTEVPIKQYKKPVFRLSCNLVQELPCSNVHSEKGVQK